MYKYYDRFTNVMTDVQIYQQTCRCLNIPSDMQTCPPSIYLANKPDPKATSNKFT